MKRFLLLLIASNAACSGHVTPRRAASAYPPGDDFVEIALNRAAFDFPSCPRANVVVTPNYTSDTATIDACGEHASYRCPEQTARKISSIDEYLYVYRTCYREPLTPEQACAKCR